MEKMSEENGKESVRSNLRVAVMCMSMVAGMAGLAYASVPLYDLFCRVTGYGGTTQRAENSNGIPIIDEKVTVRFDANTGRGLEWNFEPVQRSVTLRFGEQMQVSYRATNTSDRPLTGTASFNVTPQAAGIYFNKIECFCFTETTLQPGETMEMPVVFFVDPDMIGEAETRSTRTITLSYTFFETEPADKPVAGLASGSQTDDNQL